MKVMNVNGTSDNICRCGTWLEHWRKFSNQPLPICCPEKHCMQMSAVGAHVQKDDPTDRGWYIIPLCNGHSRETGKSLEVGDSIALVPADVSQTCG